MKIKLISPQKFIEGEKRKKKRLKKFGENLEKVEAKYKSMDDIKNPEELLGVIDDIFDGMKECKWCGNQLVTDEEKETGYCDRCEHNRTK